MSDHLKKPISIKDLLGEPGAVGISSDYKDHTDPKYIGPGTWNIIHRYAFKSRIHTQQLAFIEFMKITCHEFPCTVCKGHCTEYIKNHPLEEYLDVLVEINGEKLALGLFVWSWKFHNAVNARIKKPLMSWDTAYNLYSETESLVCSKSCLDAETGIHGDDQPPDGLQHNTNMRVESSIVPKLPEFPRSRTDVIAQYFPTSKSVQPFRLVSRPRY